MFDNNFHSTVRRCPDAPKKLFGLLRISAALCLLSLVAALCLCLCSCSFNAPKTTQFFAMDTLIEFTAYGDTDSSVSAAAQEKIRDLEKLLSSTVATSEISRVNSANGSVSRVSEDVLIPVRTALDISAKSGGALDISVYPVVKAWGFVSKDYRVPTAAELNGLLELVDYEKITVGDGTLQCPKGMQLDLGAVAKGYASQCAAEIFRDADIPAVISLGGNVQTVGTKPDSTSWRIAVCDPFDHENSTVGTISVGEAAVVTSGSYQRFFESGGKTYHHIIDPSTGLPAESNLASVTVVCDDGTDADGLSTALFVLGLERSLEYHDTYGGFEAVFVTTDRRVVLTDGLTDSFEPADGTEFSVVDRGGAEIR